MNPEPNLQEDILSSPLSGTDLLSDPFSPTAAGHLYYAGADGAQRLDLLLHLAPYSPLLVISGKPGTGKTALLRQFMARANDAWRLALVTARVDMGRDELLRDMARGFGLPLDPDIDHQQLYAALIDQLRALRQNAQVPILLLDDAQYLSATMMELILKLCGENDDGHILSMLLFGTPQLQNLLDSPALTSLAARVTHTFEVTPLDEEETGAYLRHRLRAAGAEDDAPFDAVMINKIYAASGGVPARINELAQRALDDNTLSEPPRRGAGKRTAGSGKGKRLVLVSLAVVAGALMVAGPLRTALFKPEAPLTKAVPIAKAPPAPVPEVEERVIRGPKDAAPAVEEIKTLPLPPEAATSPKPALPAPDGGAAPMPVPSAAEPPAVAEMPTSLDEQPATAERPAVAEAPAAAPKPPIATPAAPAKTPPARVVRAKAAPPPPAKPGLRGADWVRAQPQDHFTLQLMALREEKTARQFITLHHLQDQAAYIPVHRNGGVLYALLYGSYPSRIEATRAATALPAKWGAPNPWIRSFKGVHGELEN